MVATDRPSLPVPRQRRPARSLCGRATRLLSALPLLALAFLPRSAVGLGEEIRLDLLTGSYVQVLGPAQHPTGFWLYALLVNPTDDPILMIETRCRATPAGETPVEAVKAVAGENIDLCHETWARRAAHPPRKSHVHRIALRIPPAYLGQISRKRFATDDFVRVVGFRLTEAGRTGTAGLSFGLEIRTPDSRVLRSGLYRLEPITAHPAKAGVR